MLPPSIARETIQVIRAAEVIDHGSTYKDWTNATETPLSGCLSEPGLSSENFDLVKFDYVVYAPLEADVLSTDRVRLPSGVYEVQGDPTRLNTGNGRLSHTIIHLNRYRG